MSCTRRDIAAWGGAARWLSIALTALAIALLPSLAAATPAQGSMGYELASSSPVLVSGIVFPHGVAVDQVNHRVYVAVVSTNPSSQTPTPGEIRRFESDGTAAGTFTVGADSLPSGVAVDPVTQGFYASQVEVKSSLGSFGTAQMDPFSSAGVLGTPFPLSATDTLPQIATDSTGDVYFPNSATDSVQVFNSAGVLQETIGCGGCPGGAFGKPVSVAIDSDDSLYVVDLAPDRVLKFTSSGGSYGFSTLLQSGRGAAAVGVDPSTDDVFVGDYPNGTRYHIVAYNSSGSQFDDFGAELFIDFQLGAIAASQMAADGTTHKLYVARENKIYVFERVTISPPSATTNAASAIVQLGASLNATVNAKGHAVLDCHFEYVDDAEFQSNGFANAVTAPCSKKPDGSSNVAVKASISGLSPATKYHFRAIAESNAGATAGNELTFTTLPSVPPTVITDPAVDITQTSASLVGRVNPHGGTVADCHFESGTTLTYGSSVPCETSIGPVTTEVTQKLNLKGLSVGTAYHYRLVVTTNAGSAGGDDTAFTTFAPPSPPVTPQPPAPEADPPIAAPPQPMTCKRGFVKRWVGGKTTCVKRCRKGFVRRRVQGKYKCLKLPSRPRAGRR